MAFQYASVEEAIERDGLRMVVVGDVPSPWTEAAKGLLHVAALALRSPATPGRAWP